MPENMPLIAPVHDPSHPSKRPLPFSGAKNRTIQQMLMISICLGWFMAALDNTIVNVALTSIGGNLHTDVTGLQWVVDSYALVYASLLLTGGALGDRLGSKRMYLLGVLIFSGASALCGCAPALWLLLAARIAQGLGAALITPNSLALINRIFSDPKARARAIAFWAAMGGVALALGPMLGGLLVGTLGWRSIFFINLLPGLAGYALTARLVAPSAPPAKRSLDVAAQVMAIIALSALTFVLIEGSKQGWFSPFVLSSGAVGVLAGGIFLTIEQRSKAPMLPLHLFRLPTFSVTTVVGLILNFGYYGFIFLLSLFFEQVRGYTPLMTGLAFLPMTTTVVLANVIAGRLTGRFGPRLPMSLGIAACGVGLLALWLVNATTPYISLFFLLLLIGVGGGLTVPPMTTALLGTVAHERSGMASGVLNASRQLGGVLGVALFGSLVQVNSSFVHGMHLAALIAGCAALVGCIMTWCAVQRQT
jgi:DHA2 family methylenomycin A resistance protein-like MFS transporter